MSIKVSLSKAVFSPKIDALRVSSRENDVLLSAGSKKLAIKTPQAVKLGLALVKKSSEADFSKLLVVLNINGENIDLLPEQARQLGGALLRKADKVDDLQILRGSNNDRSTLHSSHRLTSSNSC